MTADEIRENCSEEILEGCSLTQLQTIKVAMLAEIAAQLAELNETMKAIAENYILGEKR